MRTRQTIDVAASAEGQLLLCFCRLPWDGETAAQNDSMKQRSMQTTAAGAGTWLLVDQARRKNTAKHGGDWARIEIADIESTTESKSDNLIALDEALTKLAAEEPAKAELVKLRYFPGLSVEEAADAMGISRTTASRYWT